MAGLWEDRISTVISAQWFNLSPGFKDSHPLDYVHPSPMERTLSWWHNQGLMADKQNNSVLQGQAQWAWLGLWTVITWKKQRHLKDEQSTLVQEPSLCFSSQNDHGISMTIPRQAEWTLTTELITTCQAGFHWVPMETSTQLYQEPSKGAAQLLWKGKKSIHYVYLHSLFVSLFHLDSRGRRTWSPSHSSWSTLRESSRTDLQ